MNQYKNLCIEHLSPEYFESVALRDVILRKPIGLEFLKEELEEESDSFHLSVWKDKEILACLVLKPISSSEIKMRQVAVRSDLQGKGIGTQLVRYAESFAKAGGYKKISLHARVESVHFYEKLGYSSYGPYFVEVGIPHIAYFIEL